MNSSRTKLNNKNIEPNEDTTGTHILYKRFKFKKKSKQTKRTKRKNEKK
jgi:hypothetical protein